MSQFTAAMAKVTSNRKLSRKVRRASSAMAMAMHRNWADLSKRSVRLGRPPISRQVRELIRTMALANTLWRAPRIHGELRKLGIEISERTVSRILQTVKAATLADLEDISSESYRGDGRD
jgi:hypothetical protein